MSEQEKFVPIDAVAEHFSVSISTVRSWVKQNRIPRDTFIKLGNTYRFQLSAVVDALTNANAAPESETPEDNLSSGDDLSEPFGDDDSLDDL